jgi:hypothetical protein
MKNIWFLIIFLLVASCQKAPSEVSDQIINKSFKLGIGESVTIKPDNVQIGFDTVISDSRCPIGVVCLWEGESQIKISLIKSRTTIIYGEIPIRGYVTAKDTCCHKYIDLDGYRITLMQLDPYPQHPIPNDYTKYRATLIVNRIER